MQKTTLFNLLLFICTCVLLLGPFKTFGQLVLPDEPIPIKPKEFYIAGVNDERNDKLLLQLIVKDPANKPVTKAMDLQGGTATAVKGFVTHNLPRDKMLRPVMISIKEFKLVETVLADGRIDGRLKLHLSFSLQKPYGTEQLVDYKGGLHYTRDFNNTTTAAHSLSGILTASLVYFNDWIKANTATNRKLAKDVQLSFTDYTEKPEGDTIYYSSKRPLTWADFQSHIRPSRQFEAQVMPGIGYDQEAEMTKGTIHVKIAMKAYVPKSACWADYSGRDNYTLNHEQRHFDIVKIISERFKQKILSRQLTPDNFEAIINMQYLDSYRDMDVMQTAYDKETGHGINRSVQAMWNDRIDKELATF